MLAYQTQEIAEAEQRLSKLQQNIRDTSETLTGIRSAVAAGEKAVKQQRAQQKLLRTQFATELLDKRAELSAIVAAAQAQLAGIQARYTEYAAASKEQQTRRDMVRQKQQAEIDTQLDSIRKQQEEISQLDRAIEAQRAQQTQAMARQEKIVGKLKALEEQLVAGETALSNRSAELQTWVKEWQHRLDKIKRELYAYEAVMQAVRKRDEARKKELDNQQQEIVAQQRAVHTARRDLQEAKKQFYQTKEL